MIFTIQKYRFFINLPSVIDWSNFRLFCDELLEIYNSREIDSLLRIVVKEILNLNYAEFIDPFKQNINRKRLLIDC